jgi:transposase
VELSYAKAPVLLHDNAPAHRSLLVWDFLAKNNVTTLEHPPSCPELAAADFYLFPQLKSALKGQHYRDATDIKNAPEELKRLSQNSFQECFQHIYSRWQKCIFTQGDYFEGNVAYVVVLFCISRKQTD